MTPTVPPRPRIVVGIDLGTTNSLVAVRAGKLPHVLRNQDGQALVPSVVSLPPGQPPLIGQRAKAEQLRAPECTIASIKRLMGRSADDARSDLAQLPYQVVAGPRGLARVAVAERLYSPEELSALILCEVKRIAEAALSTQVHEAVITVPAWFDDNQRQATKDAAQLAGLSCLRILNEPTAAALAYGIDGSKDGTVLVYDLGGGTFDVSILRIEAGVFRVLATSGDTHLGGDDFDALLSQRILALLPEAARRSPSPFVRAAVRDAGERLKIRLSEAEQATLVLELGDLGKHDLTIARSEFEAAIAPLVQRTLDGVQRAMRDAGIKSQDIDHAVLVGGSTRVPLVRKRLQALLGQAPRTDVDPDLAVALGAAVQADILAGNDRSVLLLDVIPLSLGLETLGGAVQKLILRNSTIPTSVTEEFSTGIDGQTAVDLTIYQGERELAADCRRLGHFKLAGIPPLPAGLPRIAVTFLVDADGVLRVHAREQRTGVEAGIQVVPSYGLTRDEVRRMMLDSIEHAQADYVARERIDLRNKATAMVRGATRALALAELPPDQTYAVHKAINHLERLLAEPADSANLKQASDELAALTATIADDVISSAVSKALREDHQP